MLRNKLRNLLRNFHLSTNKKIRDEKLFALNESNKEKKSF